MLHDNTLSINLKTKLKEAINKYSPKEMYYKEFCSKIINDEDINDELKNFFKNLPNEYKQKVNERCRLLVNNELFLPANLLDHDFFSIFHYSH